MLVRGETEGSWPLSTVVPDAWLGQSWEAQDLPTAEGRLGFAVRWHGDRPALLWELVPHPGSPGAVEITGCPASTRPGVRASSGATPCSPR